MQKNKPSYEDVAATLLVTQREADALRKELRKAYKRIMELEAELEDERYRHDRQIDWYLARERELEAEHGKA